MKGFRGDAVSGFCRFYLAIITGFFCSSEIDPIPKHPNTSCEGIWTPKNIQKITPQEVFGYVRYPLMISSYQTQRNTKHQKKKWQPQLQLNNPPNPRKKPPGDTMAMVGMITRKLHMFNRRVVHFIETSGDAGGFPTGNQREKWLKDTMDSCLVNPLNTMGFFTVKRNWKS